MTHDELCGHVADVLAIASLSDSQTLRILQSRANGVNPEQLLAAAITVAREQVSQKISELERALDDSEQERQQIEDEMQKLRFQITRLVRKRETQRKRT
jgi:hypothetical protein